MILLSFGLFFVYHLLRADARATLLNTECEDMSKSTAAILKSRNKILSNLLANITSDTPTVRFYNTTAGDIANKVYVLFQCREDLSLSNCGGCLEKARDTILDECRLYNEGTVWYEKCLLRFAHRNIFSLSETELQYYSYNGDHVSKYEVFGPVLTKTMDGVIKTAAMSTNGSHFAASEMNYTLSKTVYSLAQCTSDLNRVQCQDCLDSALAYMAKCCNASIGVKVFLRSCQLRYDSQPILVGDESHAASPSPLPPADQGDKGSSASASATLNKGSQKPTIIVAAVFATLFGILLLLAGLWLCLRRRKAESFQQLRKETNGLRDVVAGSMDDIRNLESLQFDFRGVEAATDNFSVENKLGQGGFGEVFKGKFSNGEEIAVKRLSQNSQQGANEFKNEVLLLAKLQHRNLVKLLGFCISDEEKILIYEFLANSSLDRFLFDPLKRASLEWELRYKIITGIARGLLYLHEDSRLKIIHRDLKASNILLDEAMNAKIADFGIARLFNLDQTQGATIRISGTYGYMAPEYALAGHFSVKSDVYSFGVIILETVSGQRNSFFHQQPDEGLVYRAWRLWNEGASLEFADTLLGKNICEEEVKLCIQIGLLCVQEDATHRPRMASIVAALNGQAITLPLPNAPHFFPIGDMTDTSSSNFNSLHENEGQPEHFDHAYTGRMTITDLGPR